MAESFGGTTTNDPTVQAINDALVAHPEVEIRGIDIRVESGVVTLAGNVYGDAERARVEEIVRGIGGVREVRNQLKVWREQPVGPSA